MIMHSVGRISVLIFSTTERDTAVVQANAERCMRLSEELDGDLSKAAVFVVCVCVCVFLGGENLGSEMRPEECVVLSIECVVLSVRRQAKPDTPSHRLQYTVGVSRRMR